MESSLKSENRKDEDPRISLEPETSECLKHIIDIRDKINEERAERQKNIEEEFFRIRKLLLRSRGQEDLDEYFSPEFERMLRQYFAIACCL